MRFPPPSVTQHWPKPNYVNPETRGPSLIIIESVFLALAIVTVSLRIYVRGHILKRLWYDDWLMVGALLCTSGVTICVLLASTKYGWDIHIWDLPLTKLAPSRKVSIAGQTLFLGASGLTKLSMLISYIRIAVIRSFRIAIDISLVICTLYIIVFGIVLWTQCVPIRMYWTLTTASDRHCIPEGPPLLGQSVSTILTDFLVYFLPMPVIWHLRMPKPQKIGLICLFALGLFVCIAGVLRAYYTLHVVYDSYDVTWDGYELWIFTALETHVGIIAGSIPSLKPLFFRRSTQSSSGYSGTVATIGTKKKKLPASLEDEIELNVSTDQNDELDAKPASTGTDLRVDSRIGGPSTESFPSHMVDSNYPGRLV